MRKEAKENWIVRYILHFLNEINCAHPLSLSVCLILWSIPYPLQLASPLEPGQGRGSGEKHDKLYLVFFPFKILVYASRTAHEENFVHWKICLYVYIFFSFLFFLQKVNFWNLSNVWIICKVQIVKYIWIYKNTTVKNEFWGHPQWTTFILRRW
jgi:hypothetical protein